jgi:dTDP-4-dehydrorhamnose reductase
MRKVLLLGSSGLLGQAVKSEFSDLELICPLHNELDVTDFTSLGDYINCIKPDTVINCTGFNAVDDAEKPEFYKGVFLLNAEVPRNLALYSLKYNFKLLQFSSDYVFDGLNADGYNEDSVCSPLNVYGSSKLAGEKFISSNCEKYFIIRISWLFGPGKSNFVSTMLDLAKTHEIINVVSDQFGKPTYSKDVASALRLFTDSTDYGIYHLPNEGSVSWHEFAENIFRISGSSVKVKESTSQDFKRLAERPKSSILVNSKLPKQRNYKEALTEYINNYI